MRGRLAAAAFGWKPEPAGDNDPYPGRFLNPHKKSGSLCRILKHAQLLRWIRLLMEREPKPLQTILSHKGSAARRAFGFDPHDHLSAWIFVRCVDRV